MSPSLAAPEGRDGICIVIPARLESQRLPRKLLLRETGKPLIQHTYEAACRARRPSLVCVATDSREIQAAVEGFGGTVLLTSTGLASGTDRVAEAVRALPTFDIVVNVQGDEPLISGEAIDQVIQALEDDLDVSMATLATRILSRDRWQDPSCVKVVFNSRGRALYFSRAPIPHPGHANDSLAFDGSLPFFQHLGVYGYRRSFLLEFVALPPSPLERLERLEQIRVLQAGHAILVREVSDPAFGIDTAEDYRTFVERVRGG